MDYLLEEKLDKFLPKLLHARVSIWQCFYKGEKLDLIPSEFRGKKKPKKWLMVLHCFLCLSLFLCASARRWGSQVYDGWPLQAADSLPWWRQDHVWGFPERTAYIWWVGCEVETFIHKAGESWSMPTFHVTGLALADWPLHKGFVLLMTTQSASDFNVASVPLELLSFSHKESYLFFFIHVLMYIL